MQKTNNGIGTNFQIFFDNQRGWLIKPEKGPERKTNSQEWNLSLLDEANQSKLLEFFTLKDQTSLNALLGALQNQKLISEKQRHALRTIHTTIWKRVIDNAHQEIVLEELSKLKELFGLPIEIIGELGDACNNLTKQDPGYLADAPGSRTRLFDNVLDKVEEPRATTERQKPLDRDQEEINRTIEERLNGCLNDIKERLGLDLYDVISIEDFRKFQDTHELFAEISRGLNNDPERRAKLGTPTGEIFFKLLEIHKMVKELGEKSAVPMVDGAATITGDDLSGDLRNMIKQAKLNRPARVSLPNRINLDDYQKISVGTRFIGERSDDSLKLELVGSRVNIVANKVRPYDTIAPNQFTILYKPGASADQEVKIVCGDGKKAASNMTMLKESIGGVDGPIQVLSTQEPINLLAGRKYKINIPSAGIDLVMQIQNSKLLMQYADQDTIVMPLSDNQSEARSVREIPVAMRKAIVPEKQTFRMGPFIISVKEKGSKLTIKSKQKMTYMVKKDDQVFTKPIEANSVIKFKPGMIFRVGDRYIKYHNNGSITLYSQKGSEAMKANYTMALGTDGIYTKK